MKQSFFILVVIFTLFISCLEEGINGCPDYIRVSFLYDDSSRGYDDVIGNEVHLRLYKDGILYSNRIIPYEEIEGGREYIIKKEFTGEVDFVAWAIPAGEDFVAVIPDVPESRARIEEKVVMQSAITRNIDPHYTHESIGELYLGTIGYYDSDISKEVKVRIPMTTCISRFTATLHTWEETSSFEEEQDQLWLEVYGTKSEMDLNFEPQGKDAIVKTPFIEKDEEGKFKTGVHGLLPSDEGQYIFVKGYRGNTHLFTINTNHCSSPGEKIHIDIFAQYVVLQVNDWRVINIPIKWI